MKVLIACEESQTVCKAFRDLGHEAYSCDILPCSGGHPEWHIQEDVLKILRGVDIVLETGDHIWIDNWDLMIAHPPCSHLSTAGAHLWKQKFADGRIQEAFHFVLRLWQANISKICIENPVGWMNTHWQKPSQIIHPFHFGEPFMKRTCLWLKNLPLLQHTEVVQPEAYWINSTYRPNASLGNKGLHHDPQQRSKFFKGIADAMAKQWGRTQ